MGRLDFVLGEQGSGKSAWAERELLSRCPGSMPVYIATLPQLRRYGARIAKHRARRGNYWHLLEIRLHLDEVFEEVAAADMSAGVLLDGLVAFVARRLFAAALQPARLESEIECLRSDYRNFLDKILTMTERLFIVSNIIRPPKEGQGASPIDLIIRDVHLGLCEWTARAADKIWLISAGEPSEADWNRVLAVHGAVG